MIKDIFLPEHIGSYYLLQKRVLSIVIGRTHIYAVLIKFTRNNKFIEQIIDEPIENNSNLSNEQRTVNALSTVFSKIGKYDVCYSVISSSLVIFKELNLPFLNIKKIKMVLPYEVENLLPFSLEQASVDAIITKQNLTENNSDIFIAAVKKEYIEEHLKIFEAIDSLPDKITIDVFELYGLYLKINNNFNDQIALINISNYNTSIAIIIKNQLKYIRSIPKGFINICKEIQNSSNVDLAQINEYLLRFGLNEDELDKYHDENFKKIVYQTISTFINEISFTISAYTTKVKNIELNKIILTGKIIEIPQFASFLENSLRIKTEILDIRTIINAYNLETKIKHIPNSFIISLAAALPNSITENFNLQKIRTNIKKERKTNYQILAILSLLGLIFTTIMIFSFIRISELKKTYNKASQEALTQLKKSFNIAEKSAKSLKSANNAANLKLNDLKKKWSPLSNKSMFSFLKYLYELSRHINKLGLDLNSITMDQDEIVIRGSVKNVDALRKLETQLKSELFTLEEPPQTPDFRQKPIRLKIKDHKEE